MKKTVSLLLLIMLSVIFAMSLIACEEETVLDDDLNDLQLEEEQEPLEFMSATVIFTNELGEIILTFKRETTATNFSELITEINNTDDTRVVAKQSNDGYGYYISKYTISYEIDPTFLITEAGSTYEDSEDTSEYIVYPTPTVLEDGTEIASTMGVFVYTTLTDSQYLALGRTATFDGVEYNAVGKSASDLPIIEGVVFVVTVEEKG